MRFSSFLQGGGYKLSSSPSMPDDRVTGPHEFGSRQDWGMIYLVKVLSNVSVQFREELGTAFWTRAHLSIDDFDEAPDVFSQFLMNRPAAHEGIKMLCLSLSHRKLERYYWSDVDSVCQTVTGNIQLEELYINLSVPSDIIKELSTEREKHQWLRGLRQLHVSQYFKLDLEIWYYGPEGVGGDKEWRICEDLRKEYAPHPHPTNNAGHSSHL